MIDKRVETVEDAVAGISDGLALCELFGDHTVDGLGGLTGLDLTETTAKERA